MVIQENISHALYEKYHLKILHQALEFEIQN